MIAVNRSRKMPYEIRFTQYALRFIVFSALLFLTACQGADSPAEVYRPASVQAPVLSAPGDEASARSSPTPAPLTSEPPQPTPTPACTNSLRYVEDLTIPDGSTVAAGQLLDKRWRVENNGNCNWDELYRLKLTNGPAMGATAEQTLYPAHSGAEALIRIQFSAPNEAGTYRSAWQAYDPQGLPFGDAVFIEIQVSAP